MITSKQRSYLKSLAHNIEPIFQVGKGGVTENVIKQVDDALEARELIKLTVLNNSVATSREVLEEIASKTNAEAVQAIGKKIVLYRESKRLKEAADNTADNSKRIVLPKK